jgi:two-component system chemotaxis sensor kinase CheA
MTTGFVDETLTAFLEEAREHLDQVERDLLALESGGRAGDPDLVHRVFRAVHSIKGGAAFLGFDPIKVLAHRIENVLGPVRRGEIEPAPDVVAALLSGVDLLARMIADPTACDAIDAAPAHDALGDVLGRGLSENARRAAAEDVDVTLPDGRVVFRVARGAVDEARKAENGGEHLFLCALDLIHDIHEKGRNPLGLLRDLADVVALIEAKVDVEAVGGLTEFTEHGRLPFYLFCATKMEAGLIEDLLGFGPESLHRIAVAEPEAPARPAARPADLEPQSVADPTPAPPRTLRVAVAVVDRVLELAEELGVACDRLARNLDPLDAAAVRADARRMEEMTTELRGAIRAARLQPVGPLFAKYRRLVHDLAAELGKRIDLVVEGEDVELDKAVLDAIGDPLTHLVRNAIDHGVEPPGARRAAGKDEVGRIRLTARPRGARVIVEVADDGGGIDAERVRAKARALGLLPPASLDALSDREILRLVFRPGFSMADRVTEVSGRGVGMDVVLSDLARIGGVVDIDSEKDRGTTMRLTLPLSPVGLPGMLVTASGATFAIPRADLVAVVPVAAAEVPWRIERIHGMRAMVHDDAVLPLLRLADIVGTGGEEEADADVSVVVVATREIRYGLIVDTVLGPRELVVRPLDDAPDTPGDDRAAIAGRAAFGNGRAAWVLDVAAIADRIHDAATGPIPARAARLDSIGIESRSE